MRILGKPLYTIGLLAVFGLGGCRLEDRFLYFPDSELVSTPEQMGLAYEDVELVCEDGISLHGWFIPGQDHRPVILFFHGNAGNISHRLENLYQLHHQLGTPVLIINYRGYGPSEGSPDEQGLYLDAKAASAWLTERGYEPRWRIYFGRSLGAAVALQLALEDKPGMLVMESPFTSIRAMGRHHYPLLHTTLGWLLDARFDNLTKISLIDTPLTIIHGRRDRIVPPSMAQELFEQAQDPKQIFWLEQAGHNNTLYAEPNRYWAFWQQIMADAHSMPSP
jgi:fermentation-respiration switch protein FrsA (DUF1100 family)